MITLGLNKYLVDTFKMTSYYWEQFKFDTMLKKQLANTFERTSYYWEQQKFYTRFEVTIG